MKGTPIRLLHFADLHIGVENYGQIDRQTGLHRRVLDFLHRLDEVVAYALRHEADVVLFAGDAFRTRSPEPTHQREFAARIRRLSQAGIAVVLLVGNHDVPAIAQRASSLDIFSALGVPNVTVLNKARRVRLETKHGPLQIVGLPYPIRQRLLKKQEYRKLTPEQLDDRMTGLMLSTLRRLSAEVEPEVPAVLAGHFSLGQAADGSERKIMVGRGLSLPRSEIAAGPWAYVALGHIHRHQDVNEGRAPGIVYAGSLERIDFGEEEEAKGFVWVEIAPDETTWRFIEVKARPMLTIEVDVREADAPLALVQRRLARRQVRDAIVRLIIRMRPEQREQLRNKALTALLKGAFHAKIIPEVEYPRRDRLAGVELEAMTPALLLERYLVASGKPPEVVRAFLEEAATIFERPA